MGRYFIDPVLRAPTIGSMLMCMAAGLVGVLVFVRKRSLLGESLSHAAYPGVILALLITTTLFPLQEESSAIGVLVGAFLSSFLGLFAIDFLEKKFRVKSDAALCFILSSFFGIGITLASRAQMTFPKAYRQMQLFLFGQAATMTDIHIVIYAVLAALIILTLSLFYKEFKTINFDFAFAKSLGVPTKLLETATYVLIVLAVVVGMRSVGVVLMSAMLIAPAVAARQYTNKLCTMFFLAGFFGLLSGYLGNFFSLELSLYFDTSLATGPMIVMVATLLCLFSLLFAREKGLIVRLFRAALFRQKCALENILKALWRAGRPMPYKELKQLQRMLHSEIFFVLLRIRKEKLIVKTAFGYILTESGKEKAAHIVRLHRLWEVYLANYLGVGKERVHKSAEEMEHLITPELEKELTKLLGDPIFDPHHQLIPRAP